MIRLFRQYISTKNLVFVLGEGVLIFFAIMIASVLILEGYTGQIEIIKTIWLRVLLVAVITQMSLYFNDLYEIKRNENMIDMATRLIQAIGVTSIVLAVIYFLWPQAMIGRWIFFASIIILLLFIVSWRLLYAYSLRKRLFAEKAIMIGAGNLANDILVGMEDRGDLSYNITTVYENDNPGSGKYRIENIPIRNGFESLCTDAEQENISSIIVALDQKRGVMPYKELLECKVKGITIIDGENFYERITGKLLVDKINPSLLIFSDGFVKSRGTRFLKRLSGFFFSFLIGIIASPVILVVALAIKMDSRGPVLFSQDRVGENGKIFTLYKFRSMRMDAEKKSGPVWASEDDPRTTRLGRYIRKVRIDELPQLWNVIKADMSFVGPRPERPFFVEELRKKIPYYNERFSVKPGITGWAQIKYPYGSTEEDAKEKLKYELYYIKNMSIVFDFIVIFHTIKIVLLGRGAK